MNKEKNTHISQQDIKARPNYENDIISVIRSNISPRIMREKLDDYHRNDIAEALDDLTPKERKKLYRILSETMLSEIFEYLDTDEAGIYLDELDLIKASAIISEMEPDAAVELLKEIDKEKRNLIIDLMDEESKNDMWLIASFDEDEIGSKMTTNYIEIKTGLTVKQAMNELVRQAEYNDNISTLFVADDSGAFYGALDLKDLITARENSNLDERIVTTFPYVYGQEDIDDCIEKLKDYLEDSIPVLDNENRIIGVITAQNLVQVVDDEMGEDYARFAGLTAEEDLSETLPESMRKRLPWLFVLLGLGMIVSSVVGTFEKVVSQLPLIMAFQSLILDMAGNAGTQSLAVTIRVLMDETLTFKQKMFLVAKEMRVGLCNGFLLGTVSFILVGLYIFFVKGNNLMFAYSVSGCIGISLILAMLIASLTGTLIPLFFNKIDIDPAVASGPLITTVNDLVAVITYYGLSWILLLQIMQFGS